MASARDPAPVLHVLSATPFLTTLACVWIALFGAAYFYSQQHPQSHWIMSAALPAFLMEAVFYLGSVFQPTRTWFQKIRSRRFQALLLWLSALLPYWVFASRAEILQRNAFEILAMLTGLLAYWYVLLPRRAAYDAGFLVIAAAPIIARVFPKLYVVPGEHFPIDILGHLMWIRLGIAALLIFREWDPGAFGFWPRAREWRLGFLYYLALVIPIMLLALALGDVRYAPARGEWWQIAGLGIGTFFGILWVVALGEELFFRGVIERAMLNVWRSPTVAVVLSAVLFGGAHLWFRQFPNWRRALVATLLGIACGLAYARTGSVRTPMVTHAFVVTTWRIFFR